MSIFSFIVDRIFAAFKDVFTFTTPAAAAAIVKVQTVSPDVDIMARTLYGEARNGGEIDMRGVAEVIMRRYRLRKDGKGYPTFGSGSIANICLAPYQFSCWNKDDPNRAIIMAVQSGNSIFDRCMNIAAQYIEGKSFTDVTNGADHYYAEYLKPPTWAVGKKPVARIGAHLFFRLIPDSVSIGV